MIAVSAFTRIDAAAVAHLALEFVNEIRISNVSGSVDCWQVIFDPGVVMSFDELSGVVGNRDWCNVEIA